MELKLQLQTLKKENMLVDDFIMCLKSLANNLSTICECVQQKDLILYAIGGLGNKCNPFVCNIIDHARTISIKEFHNRLLVYEHHLTE